MDPHPVIVTLKDNRNHIRVASYSYATTQGMPGVACLRGAEDGIKRGKSCRDLTVLTLIIVHAKNTFKSASFEIWEII